jgi:DNA mismatch endonuclease (patch repair protein)
VDTISPDRRSLIMARVRGKDTGPEMVVRRMVYAMGYRYRLHAKDLPGKPDLVFRGRRKVIFVHGCFWHRHAGCALARLPKSRVDFWVPKLEANRQRDARHKRDLAHAGWKVLTVWECDLKERARMKIKIGGFLDA